MSNYFSVNYKMKAFLSFYFYRLERKNLSSLFNEQIKQNPIICRTQILLFLFEIVEILSFYWELINTNSLKSCRSVSYTVKLVLLQDKLLLSKNNIMTSYMFSLKWKQNWTVFVKEGKLNCIICRIRMF